MKLPKLKNNTKKNLKAVAIFWAVIITALFIKIFVIGFSEPSPGNGNIQNMLLSANITPIPTIPPELAEMQEKHKQEVILLQSKITELNEKLSLAESDLKEKLKKDAVINAINKHLGGVFKGKGDYIATTCKKYNVNPMLLSAIMKLETRNGTSDVCKSANNPGGLNYFDGCGYPKYGWYQKFPSIEIGIEKMAKLIKECYIDQGKGDIASIGKKYAPPNDKRNGIGGMDNKGWPKHVTDIYTEILNDAEKIGG